MSIHPKPPTQKPEVSFDADPQTYYAHLRAQGIGASEAWAEVKRHFPHASGGGKPAAQAGSSPHSKPASYPEETASSFWDMFGPGRSRLQVILIVAASMVWWFACEYVKAVLFLLRLVTRFLTGLLWFTLGVIVGLRTFRR